MYLWAMIILDSVRLNPHPRQLTNAGEGFLLFRIRLRFIPSKPRFIVKAEWNFFVLWASVDDYCSNWRANPDVRTPGQSWVVRVRGSQCPFCI